MNGCERQPLSVYVHRQDSQEEESENGFFIVLDINELFPLRKTPLEKYIYYAEFYKYSN